MITPVMPTYARADIEMVRGEGCYVFDSKGRKYLDFAAGIAVSAFGHGHPHLVEALKRQADLLWHTSNLYRVPGQEQVSERLRAVTRIFLQRLGDLHSHVAGDVAMGRIARALEHHVGFEFGTGDDRCERRPEQLGDLLFL